MTTPKNVIRKFPPFASFQKFLVSETSVGNISRQEVVSMIPPLLLDVRPSDTVLDLCAAPGSKSAQIIEAIHAGEEARVRTVLHKILSGNQNGSAFDASAGTSELQASVDGNDLSDDGRATGLLVANDVNYQRAQMLVHQVKRLNSPNLIVMNHDATMFPSIELPSQAGSKNKYLKFDRILADVPCSGDGTCRKNPNIWRDWIPGNALGLYTTQVRILVRALQMLKVGGRVVYSTCSMNPVENEAVVASALDRCGGVDKVQLVDCSDKLPALNRNPGLRQWKVMDKSGRTWSSWDDVEHARKEEGEAGLDRLVEGMFAPKNGDALLERCLRVYPHQQDTGGFFIAVLEKKSEIKTKPESESRATNNTPSIMSVVREIEQLPTEGADSRGDPKLETLDEILPTNVDPDNDMDGGNASAAARQNKENPRQVAVTPTKRALDDVADAQDSTKKLKVHSVREDDPDISLTGEQGRLEHYPLPPQVQLATMDTRHNPPQPSEATPQAQQIATKRRQNQPHEEHFKYLSPTHPELRTIYGFFGIDERFPRDRYMVRNPMAEPAKAIYYTSALCKSILETNEGRGMKFVHAGVKMFMKQDAQGQDICRWRIQTEGMPIVEPWIGPERQVVLSKRETLKKLLKEMFPKVGGDGWKELGEIGERVRDISMGCCVLRVEPGEGEEGFTERMVLPLWRSISSLNLMLPKEERKAMLLRLYNDDSPLIDHSQERFGKQSPTAATTTTSSDHADAQGGAPTETATELTEIDADVPAEPETLVDENGEAALDLDADEDADEATGPVASTSIGTDEDALMADDALLSAQQAEVDGPSELKAGGVREGETDEFNTTV
ncbi:tRNA (cytosine-5-)-methyltransferase ncl1 [Elasticomyces elasticus]|nr:tRNA (cytosine-5-)-methyltransferase ncl1 [Elasticomyces elasticus]